MSKFPLFTVIALGVLLGGGLGSPGTIAQTPPPATVGLSRPVLRSGNKGPAVAELQAILKLLGFYSGAVDGQYGDSTLAAVSNFQQNAGLTADGVMGSNSWQVLLPNNRPAVPPTPAPIAVKPPANQAPPKNPPTPPSAPTPATVKPKPKAEDQPLLKEGMKGEAVALLQQRLKTLGFFSGEADGIYGRDTLMAVFAAQKHFKLDADGIVGYQTWVKLLN